jgi:hypothetical protein
MVGTEPFKELAMGDGGAYALIQARLMAGQIADDQKRVRELEAENRRLREALLGVDAHLVTIARDGELHPRFATKAALIARKRISEALTP